MSGFAAPAFGFPRHEFPGDFWRFSPEALAVLFDASTSLEVDRLDEYAGEGGALSALVGRKRTTTVELPAGSERSSRFRRAFGLLAGRRVVSGRD